MILVDTSVWIDFLRNGNEKLKNLLSEGMVITHPLIIGELSCGNIKNRIQFLSLINDLDSLTETTHTEVLAFLENNRIYGKGVGYYDLHILCSAIISSVPLWTLDKRLEKIAKHHKSAF
jgi:predicted nucleic acid-binding protein